MGETFLNLTQSWVRRAIDRGVQNSLLILKAPFIYVDSLAEKTTSNGITVASELNCNDVVTHAGIIGEIHLADGSTAQGIPTGATYTKLTGFTEDGIGVNTTPDVANNQIIATRTGYYRAAFQASFIVGTANTEWRMAVFLNGVEQHNVHDKKDILTANSTVALAASGFIDITTADWVVDLRVRHDNGGSVNITPEYMNLNIEYVGAT